MEKQRKRRFWSDDERRMICGQTRVPGVSVSLVARRHDVNAKLISAWLRDPQFADAGAADEARLRPVADHHGGSGRKLKSRKEVETAAGNDAPVSSILDGLSISNRLLMTELDKIGVRRKNRSDGTFSLKREDDSYRVRDGKILRSFNSKMANKICNCKDIASRLLARAGASVPENFAFGAADAEHAWLWSQPILPVVLKPVDSRKGEKVFVRIQDKHEFLTHFEDIASSHGRVLVEQFLEGTEYRFFYLTGEIIAVTQRVPANVIGDGKSSIAGLVDAKNAEREARANPVHKQLSLDTESLRVIAEQGLDKESVIPSGQRIYLRRQSNISTGGDAIDATDIIDNVIKDHIAKVCQFIEPLNVAGVDVIINEGSASILEINCKPMVSMHHFPWEGQPREIAPAITRAMFPSHESKSK